jgi:hypothetical protein
MPQENFAEKYYLPNNKAEEDERIITLPEKMKPQEWLDYCCGRISPRAAGDSAG